MAHSADKDDDSMAAAAAAAVSGSELADQVENMALENDQYDDDEFGPAFVQPGDGVEVQVDDSEPMDDDADDTLQVEQQPAETATVVDDMATHVLGSHTGEVYCVATHQQYDATTSTPTLLVVSGGGDDRAFLHRIVGHGAVPPQSVLLPHQHTDTVSCAAFGQVEGTVLLAVGSFDGSLVLYDVTTNEVDELHVFEGPTDVEWCRFHGTGQVILAGSSTDGTVWMFHTQLRRCLQVFVGHQAGSNIADGAFSLDGKTALSCSADGTLRIWAPKSGKCKHCFVFQHDGEAAAGLTKLHQGGPDGQLVVVGAEDGQAHVCHVGNKKVVASLRHYEVSTSALNNDDDDDDVTVLPMSVEAVAFAPSSYPTWCATGGVDGAIKIWDLDRTQCRHTCRLPGKSSNHGVTALQWHPTLPILFAGSTHGTCTAWDARNGALLQVWTGHTGTINDLQLVAAALDDSDRSKAAAAVLVTASDDRTVRLFAVDVPALLNPL